MIGMGILLIGFGYWACLWGYVVSRRRAFVGAAALFAGASCVVCGILGLSS